MPLLQAVHTAGAETIPAGCSIASMLRSLYSELTQLMKAFVVKMFCTLWVHCDLMLNKNLSESRI